jgi:putative ABC transport system permease protein
MTVGLVRSETAGELRTLTTIGASPRTRRTVAAGTAGALGPLGALIGSVIAYLAAAAFFWSQLAQQMSRVPGFDLLLILLGLPFTASTGGWLFAGRELTPN